MAGPTVPLASLAKLIDLTPRRIQQLVTEGVIPKADRGQFEMLPAVQAYIRYLRERALGGDIGAESLSAERARLTKAKADIAVMEREQLAAKLIPVGQIEAAWITIMTVVRTRMLAVPARSAAQIGTTRNPTEVARIIRQETHGALEELSKYRIEAIAPPDPSDAGAGDDGGAGDDQAATGADDLGVGGSREVPVG